MFKKKQTHAEKMAAQQAQSLARFEREYREAADVRRALDKYKREVKEHMGTLDPLNPDHIPQIIQDRAILAEIQTSWHTARSKEREALSRLNHQREWQNSPSARRQRGGVGIEL